MIIMEIASFLIIEMRKATKKRSADLLHSFRFVIMIMFLLFVLVWHLFGITPKSIRENPCQTLEKSTPLLGIKMEHTGFEPVTSSMPWKRAPNCANAPSVVYNTTIASLCKSFFALQRVRSAARPGRTFAVPS